MAVPSFLDTDFATSTTVNVLDMADVVTEIDTMLTSTLPVASRWTDLGGGEYRCPAQDPSGINRFFSVIFTATSATRLRFQCKDKSGATFHDGNIDRSGSTTIKIFAGPYHVVVQSSYGTDEMGCCYMSDPTPFGLNQTNVYTFAWTYRNSAGTAYTSNNQDAVASLVANDAGGTTPRARCAVWYVAGTGGVTDANGISAAGSTLCMPYEISVINAVSTNVKWAGRAYQHLLVPDALGVGGVLTVPLDDGVTGDFEVLGFDSPPFGRGRLAVRVA